MVTLVGRESALRSTTAFLDGIADTPSVLLVEGEIGLGKTAVWLSALDGAAERGHLVLRARPSESEARLAYAVVSDLVGAAFEDVRAELPAPQERALSAALLLADTDGPAELRTVATAFVSVLAALAAERQVVVAVDDLQWVDPASARVLAFAVRRLPPGVGVLLALRTEPGGRAGLPLDLPGDLATRVALEPLSLGSLHHVIQGHLGISLSRPTLTRLSAASGGNPLFALEIARVLGARPEGGAVAGPLPVPSTLQELVIARLETLSDEARSATLVAAAMSRPTTRAVARVLEGELDATSALAEAEDAGVIASEGGRIHFSHPLLASALYGAASAGERRRVHRRLADLAESPEERARHRAMSTDGPDEPAAAELEQAAQRAALRGAQEAAADLLDGACRLTPVDRADDLARRRLHRAAALVAVGDFQLAHSVAENALAQTESRPLRAEALSQLASLAWYDGDARVAITYAEAALAESDEAQGAARARLVRFNFSHDLDQALAHADAALAILDEEREPGLVAHVLIDHFFGRALAGRDVSHAELERALALEARSVAAGDAAPQPMPLLWFHCTDDLDAARKRYAMEVQWSRERGHDVSIADRMSHLAMAELRSGAWETAEELVEASCAAVDGLDARGPRAMTFEKRSLVDAHRGRTGRARETLRTLIEGYERAGQTWWAALSLSTLAFVEFVDGNNGEADDALRRMHAYAAGVGARDVVFDRSEPFHVEVLLDLGDLDGARGALGRLERRGRTLPRAWITAALPRTRALVRAAEGDVPAALELILAGEPNAGLPFEHAWTLLVAGKLHRRAKQKRAAADALTAALEAFERLGAPAFAARARGELERVGLRRAPSGLTASELRIAELAAQGRTNREIAQAAFVSQKTVEANLARVYRKLGIRSRAELGAHMAVSRDEAAQT